jgi:hypothetical protein
MTSKEMQRLAAQKRWAGKTPEERSAIMSKVREGSASGAIKGNNQQSTLDKPSIRNR